ncbi:HAD hydrolase-like protein [Candidatus Woesearchaeota archaeon]|jgi:beta-phosphoglucomutase-like phosphatase (HAD superfamily)|nr:HAD hydrolase-like protein [Candidatus Woesearchaeota archaeon]MBT3537787.1 HAD hydrolase-like protein [Candidatus Woesearchaeota archaeon]MBT4697918.1 HAD hydrolase-like protein [Candidatus Woesearchaeota archaeon]MBT4717309.1 HAD hydrolase-like protein [Candidatus Woesearchaeota archaeon]MBT7105456.1 HAD hydrolase-like protein [Candidatus Woesearchaeota archaeon]
MAIIICDLDSTLWGFLGIHWGVYEEGCKHLGGTELKVDSFVPTTTRGYLWCSVKDKMSEEEFNSKIEDAEKVMATLYKERIGEFLVHNTGECNADDHDFYAEPLKDVGLFNGAEEFLKSAKEAGHTLVVGTGNSRITGEALLEVMGLRDYFDDFAYGDEGGNRKGVMALALERGRNISPDGVAFVLDDATDAVSAGNELGVKVISMLSSEHGKKVDKEKAFASFSSISHYKAILELISDK